MDTSSTPAGNNGVALIKACQDAPQPTSNFPAERSIIQDRMASFRRNFLPSLRGGTTFMRSEADVKVEDL